MKNLKLLILLPLMLVMASCAMDISPNTYSDNATGVAAQVERGVIVSLRSVKVKGNSGVGTLAGAGAGAIAGSNIGGGRGQMLGTLAGAVVGGIAGNKVDEAVNTQDAIEYIVKQDNGKSVSVTQGPSALGVGSRVMVIYGKKARLVPER